MTKYQYDEEASERLHMAVVHEIDDSPMSAARWVEAMRRLNSINDPLARKIVELHRDCGTGTGECDSADDPLPTSGTPDWGCATTSLIADHFGVEFPNAPSDDDR